MSSHEINIKDISNDNYIVTKNNKSDVDNEIDIDQSIVLYVIILGLALFETVFSKKRVENRKKWVNDLKVNTLIEYSTARKKEEFVMIISL